MRFRSRDHADPGAVCRTRCWAVLDASIERADRAREIIDQASGQGALQLLDRHAAHRSLEGKEHLPADAGGPPDRRVRRHGAEGHLQDAPAGAGLSADHAAVRRARHAVVPEQPLAAGPSDLRRAEACADARRRAGVPATQSAAAAACGAGGEYRAGPRRAGPSRGPQPRNRRRALRHGQPGRPVRRPGVREQAFHSSRPAPAASRLCSPRRQAELAFLA